MKNIKLIALISLCLTIIPVNVSVAKTLGIPVVATEAASEKRINAILSVTNDYPEIAYESMFLLSASGKTLAAVHSNKSEILAFLLYGAINWQRQGLGELDSEQIQLNAWAFNKKYYRLELTHSEGEPCCIVDMCVISSSQKVLAQYWIPLDSTELHDLGQALCK